MMMYILYVIVVFVGRVLYQKVIKKKLLGRGDIPREEQINLRTHTTHSHMHDHGIELEMDGNGVICSTSHQLHFPYWQVATLIQETNLKWLSV